MNLIDKARTGKSDHLINQIAKKENVTAKSLLEDIRKGYTVIPKNKLRDIKKPCGIGRGLSTKVNVNLGTSPDSCTISKELKKLEFSVRLGTDAVMDLSVGKNIKGTRLKVLEHCDVPLGTVPIYEVIANSGNDIRSIKATDMINILIEQAKQGVDFFTIHAGITKKVAEVLDRSNRLIRIVSRGGAVLYQWMKLNKEENPFYERFDEVLDIAKDYDITLSLGDGMRPGSIMDASDSAQYSELKALGELQKRAIKKGVQTIIEGPGHVPLNQIRENMEKEKELCNGAPFYVLGPLVTDIAPGYDHITGAIGGALAAYYGADFLCYVTPAEHLRLPSLDDVRDGLIASKIAAHAADIAKGIKNATKVDEELSKARRARNWPRQFELALDPEKARRYRKSSTPSCKDVCTMCGNYCPIKLLEDNKKFPGPRVATAGAGKVQNSKFKTSK